MAWTAEEKRDYGREYMRKRRSDPAERARINAKRNRSVAKLKQNPEYLARHRAQQNAWYNAQSPEYKARRIAQTTADQRRRTTGVTQNMFDVQLILQNGHCAICLETEKLRADHDHKTGEFRGILCAGHNLAIGGLGDNVEGLERALAYLRR